jgi:hypothetical protein
MTVERSIAISMAAKISTATAKVATIIEEGPPPSGNGLFLMPGY